ncbi:MAG: glycosyltransferase [Thermofilaceae archaeon]
MAASKVDVLIVTYNSARTLNRCLHCIKHALPINRILVGDGGSTDSTLKIAEKHGAETYLFTGRDNMIGRIRYKLAELAETEWIVYVDSDVYLYPNWWNIMKRFAVKTIGMVMAALDGPRYSAYDEWRNKRFSFAAFSNTIVPRDLLLQCRQLLSTHVGEDKVYACFVREKGYYVVPLLAYLAYHDRSEKFDAFRRWGADMRRNHDIRFLLRAQLHLRNILWFLLEKHRFKELPELLQQYIEMYKGFLLG